jgi:DNA polymerase-3 subunit alpha
MFFKRKYPAEFFAASLAKVDRGNKLSRPEVMGLLGDTQKHGRSIPIAPISLGSADERWSLHNGAIMPGLVQVKGIGPKTADAIMEWREDQMLSVIEPPALLDIKGIGEKTVEMIEAFIEADDPFSLHVLAEKLEGAREALELGVPDPKKTSAVFSANLPVPTHTSEEVPYERTAGNVPVVWLGVIRQRNLKDLWENHFSRTGKQLDPKDVREPAKDQWVVMHAEDDTDVLVITVDRYKYPKFKDRVWSINLDEDLVLIRGYKMGKQARRAIYVTDMWILDNEEEQTDV